MDLTHLSLPIGLGILVSLAVFLFFEKKAIESKRKSIRDGLEVENISLPENFQRYNTEKNVIYYFLSMLVYTVVISNYLFFNKDASLIGVFVYIFLTTFLGSAIIFLLKIRKSILIKVFAAFLYGAPLIASSAIGFILSYIAYKNL